jgi:predicted CXXCH cytochrome family protein
VLGDDGRYVCNAGPYGGVAEARRLSPKEYQHVIEDALALEGSEEYPETYGEAVTGFSTEPAINVTGEQGVERILYAAEEVAQALAGQLGEVLPCVDDANRACAETYLETVGRRLFRRALSEDETSQLLDVFDEETDDDATFEEGVSLMTAQMLQMPAFLYVVEAPGEAGASRALTASELATRLSLHFWNSVPDDELLDLAESGELLDASVFEAQARRLFDDARSDRGFVRFLREWTGTYHLTAADKDAAVFDYLSGSFVESVNESFDRFAVKQLRDSGDLRSLLGSNQVFIDENLASFFGVDAPSSGWEEVELDAAVYTGVTTQPAMLAALSHSSETSYVFRGKFIRERLLCQNLGAPPGNAMSEFAALEKPENPTARELSDLVRARVGCGGCHDLLDPPGTVNSKMLKARNQTLCLQCHYQQQTVTGQLLIGGRDHASFVQRGTCWTAGCHEAVHGSHVNSSLRF